MLLQRISRFCISQRSRPLRRLRPVMSRQEKRFFGVDTAVDPKDTQCFMLNNNSDLYLLKGNIVQWHGDVMVNAANEAMLGGGGVDGAIHTAAGPALLEACRKQKEVRPGVRCPTGEARLTEGFRLPVSHVIHAVGPVYTNDADSSPLLTKTYEACLKMANEESFHSIAFPAISCGVYGYPIDKAAEISLEAVKKHAGNVEEVHFVLFSDPVWKAYLKCAESMFRKIPLS